MKIYSNLRRFVRSGLAQTLSRRQAEVRLAAVLLVAFAVIGMTPHFVSQAQKASVQNRVWDVSSKPAGSGTMVSIAADGPVDKQQNWQDGEGYHLVLPNTVSADSLKAVRGVKVRRVGTSLEVVFQTKPGSKVNVQTEGNEITLLVDKKLDVRQDEFSQSAPVARDVQPPTFSYPVSNPSSTSSYSSGETAHTSSTWSPSMGPTSEAPTAGLPEQAAAPAANEAPVNIEIEDEGLAASIFSGTSVFIVLTLGLVGLLVTRKLRSRQEVIHDEEEPLSDEVEWVEDEMVSNASLQMRSSRAGDGGSSVAKSSAVAATNGSPKQSVTQSVTGQPPFTGPTGSTRKLKTTSRPAAPRCARLSCY